ncbi:MAG: oligosaccharide flippase family protein [Cytophagaceae bacterium]|nr:oligosaccharide flippase family protein [Cytophagaceae bacterium]
MLKKITKHTFLYAVSPQIPKLANFFLLPVLTIYLTPEDYGIYGIILAYTGGLAALKELGLSICIVNAFTNYPQRWKFIWERLFGFLVCWSVVFTLLQTIILFLIIPEIDHSYKAFIIYGYLISGLIIDIPSIFGFRYHQLKENAVYIAIATTIVGVIAVICNFYTIAVLNLGYLGWFIAIFVSNIFTFLFYTIPLYRKYRFRPVFSFNIKFLKKYLKVGLPTIPHNYSSYLYNASDRIILERLKVNVVEIGRYNFAYTFGSYVEILNSALGMALGPLHLRLFAQKNYNAHNIIKKLTFFIQLAFLTATFLLCLWIKEIFALMVNNDQLQSCYPYAVFIIMSYSYGPMYFASINLLFYHEKTTQLWKISFIGGVINVLLNIVFVPWLGIYASIGATFIALMYIGYAGFYMNVHRVLSSVNYHPTKWIIVTILVSILVYSLIDIYWMVKALISLGILGGYIIYFLKNYKNFVNELDAESSNVIY